MTIKNNKHLITIILFLIFFPSVVWATNSPGLIFTSFYYYILSLPVLSIISIILIFFVRSNRIIKYLLLVFTIIFLLLIIHYAPFYAGIKVSTIKYMFGLCELIKEEEIKDKCYFKKVDKKPKAELCEKISRGYYKDSCYWQVAEETDNIEYCEKIEDIAAEDKYMRVKDFCYDYFAEKNNDISICEKIHYDIVKERCKRSIK